MVLSLSRVPSVVAKGLGGTYTSVGAASILTRFSPVFATKFIDPSRHFPGGQEVFLAASHLSKKTEETRGSFLFLA